MYISETSQKFLNRSLHLYMGILLNLYGTNTTLTLFEATKEIFENNNTLKKDLKNVKNPSDDRNNG